MDEAKQLTALIQEAADAIASVPDLDASGVQNLQDVLEQIEQCVNEIAEIPDELREQASTATHSATDVVRSLAASDIEDAEKSIDAVAQTISVLQRLSDQIHQGIQEVQKTTEVEQANDAETAVAEPAEPAQESLSEEEQASQEESAGEHEEAVAVEPAETATPEEASEEPVAEKSFGETEVSEQDGSVAEESAEEETGHGCGETVLAEDDLPLVLDFITEAAEHIENAEAGLLTVESTPDDNEAINLIFRGFHTVKGMAGFLNLLDIGSLAHAAENLLDLGRKGAIQLVGPNMDVIFESVDVLKTMMADLQEAAGGSCVVAANPDLPALLDKLKACTESAGSGAAESTIPKETTKQPPAAEETPPEPEQEESQEPADGCEQEVVETGNEPVEENSEPASSPVEESAETPEGVAEAQTQSDTPTPSASSASEGEVEASPAQPQEGAESIPVATAESNAAKQEKEAPKAAAAGVQRRSGGADEKIKVSTQRLDSLVNMVGELVISQSMVAQSVNTHKELMQDHTLTGKIGHQGKIVRELQELSMMMRMVPIQGVFQKMARLVRDLSQKSGKKVELITEGEETELDRIVVDQIADPLVHMIRNSVDHGIESVDDRVAAGKSEVGRVQLRAFHQAGNIVIQIVDDGKGLDAEKILAKAIDNGVVSKGENLSESDIYKLIFHAGLSTAAKVTEVSGRGVGMDVVKKNIESLRGKIEIDSKLGQGTSFTIRLPLTMAIIDGQVVRIGPERYIIPIVSIECCVRPSQSDISTVAGKGEMAMIHGNLIPMVRLYRLFGVQPDSDIPHESSLVVVEEDDKKGCLMVDELLGQHQVVIKSLGQGLGRVKGISGGAIMGDGRVSLIIDVPGLLEAAWQR